MRGIVALQPREFYQVPTSRFVVPRPDDEKFPFHPLPLVARTQDIVAHVNKLIDRYRPGLSKISFRLADTYGSAKDLPCNRVPPKRVYNVLGDGNCLYYAISRAITGSDEYQGILRALLAAYVRQYGGDDLSFIDQSPQAVALEIERGDYAGQLEMSLMAKLLGTKIVTFYPEGVDYRWFEHLPFQSAMHRQYGIYLYLCGSDLKQYANPNHFGLVMDIEM